MSFRKYGKANLFKTWLLLGAAFVSAQVSAEQTQQAPEAQPAGSAPSSGALRSAEPIAPEEILVTSHRTIAGGYMIDQREPETTNSLSAEAIAEKMGIAGPMQLIASLPGIDTGQSDPYAMSQRSYLYIRGLPSSEIGWIVDGVPALDPAFLLPYSESWADNENIAGVTILPGSSRITDPVQNAVGGEMIETTRNPANEFAANLSFGYGSYDAQRIFVGLDTGYIQDTGLKAYASYSHTQAGTFNLPGVGTRTHTDFKIEKDWSGAKSSLFLSYNDWDSERSNVFTLSGFQADQRSGNYTVGNYAASYIPGVTATYYPLNYYHRKNVLADWSNEVSLNDRLTVTIVPYYHWTLSNSPGQAPYLNPASLYSGTQLQTIDAAGLGLVNGRIPAMANSLENQNSAGINSYAKYEVSDHNELLVGWWYDHWNMAAINSYSPLDQNGNVSNVWGRDVLYSTNGQVLASANYTMQANINAFSVQDTQLFLDDKLRVDIGVKEYMESLSGNNRAPGAPPYFSSSTARVLPRLTASYDINRDMQVYADVITSTRPPIPINVYPNTYNVVTGKIVQLARTGTDPEYAVGEELGYRYHDDQVTADVALFNKFVNNRQVVASAVVNGAGVSTVIPAGNESIHGVTAEFALSPIFGFSPYLNGQYLDARTEQNLTAPSGLDYLPTKGRNAVGSPEFTGNIGLTYKNGSFFGDLLFKWTGPQYADFMNQQTMPAFHTIDLALGYYLPEGFWGKNPIIRLNFTNLENKPYLSTLISPQLNAAATRGINGTSIAAATPAYFVGSPLAVMATLSTQF